MLSGMTPLEGVLWRTGPLAEGCGYAATLGTLAGVGGGEGALSAEEQGAGGSTRRDYFNLWLAENTLPDRNRNPAYNSLESPRPPHPSPSRQLMVIMLSLEMRRS